MVIGQITKCVGVLWLLAAIASATQPSPDEGAASSPTAVHYGRDVRPILSERCFVCHGPDESTRQAGLRLDKFEFATDERDGLRAIAPSDLGGSELWRRVTSADPDDVMPPSSHRNGALTPEQTALLKQWIEDGAGYESHWSFAPPARPPLPSQGEKASGGEQASGAIDQFVLAGLNRAGLPPSPQERPEILLRRLMLDLTGLPSTPEETQRFLADLDAQDFDQVWARWVERLFTEEPYRSRYAERMTSPWLDQARYGDTNGIHTDAGRQIWPWRDWVLNAYRDNMPFDQFLTEQLAGDLLPDATIAQQIASGFNRNHVITDEGGAIDEEYLVEYAVDRASTTASVFLGLTMACARCHDHKFDPITQRDFYRFYSFFNSNEEPGLYSQLPDANRAFEPSVEVPSAEQAAQRVALNEELEALTAALDSPSAEDVQALSVFRAGLPDALGLQWEPSQLMAASSAEGASMEVTADGHLLVSGENPNTDVHTLRLHTDGQGLRLIQLDALRHPSLANGAPGRADNGNAVLTGISVQAVSLAEPTQQQQLNLTWAWADFAQDNEDYGVLRAFDDRPNTGWAIAGHTEGEQRSALFLSDEPFGFEGGTELIVTLSYESIWAGHVFGHVALSLAQLGEAGVAQLPLSQGPWYHMGPFELPGADGAYAVQVGAETSQTFDPAETFPWASGAPLSWTYQREFKDGEVIALADGVNVHLLGREVYAPQARQLDVSLGSDDGFALYVNGELVEQREVPRGVAADQDRVAITLRPGRNAIVLKVINTGGAAGFYYQALQSAERFTSALVAALVRDVPGNELVDRHAERIAHAWRISVSPEYVAGVAATADLNARLANLETEIPRTMIMQEREMAAPTFVLTRGEYDKGDPERPVLPGVPGFLGTAANEETRATRLDLAHWMTAPENPLVARVAVNRLWQMIFGTGLVQSSGNFGYQGSWPSHPELLDWLAVEFMDSGWDVAHMLSLMVNSDTYRQSSQVRPDASSADPDNHLLAAYPRRRLDAETIRDQALHVAGLLVEDLGGPSVRPYQPEGLWREVSMLASNTKDFTLGDGDQLWRRSLYTYWKRACPPPSLMTFDAPTRESCTIQRETTNTPLQALVLWNDEQFVEAARLLAERTLAAPGTTDERLASLFQRCTGRAPQPDELALLSTCLNEFQNRYDAAPDDAQALLETGVAPQAMDLDPSELAAWTMVASAALNLHATITQS